MEIRIGKAARECAATGVPFAHEDEVVSVVRIVDRQLAREDYSKAAWNDDHAKGAFSVWSMNYYDPRVAEAEPEESFSPLRQLFYDSCESEDRSDLARAYLAAQLLRRQKVFRRIKESDDPEAEVRLELFTDRIGNRLIEVRDPYLSHAELQAAQGDLMKRLEILETPEPETDPTLPPTESVAT